MSSNRKDARWMLAGIILDSLLVGDDGSDVSYDVRSKFLSIAEQALELVDSREAEDYLAGKWRTFT